MPPPIYPIQFAFPNQKIPKFKIQKENFFSDITPVGRAKKYTFFIEDDYYAHYAKSHFAITIQKAGWDCLRHYEILLSGTLTYFIGVEKCPVNTLFDWPKDLLLKVKKLPGMPSEKAILKTVKKLNVKEIQPTNDFSEEAYWKLHKEFMDFFMRTLQQRL
jgi:hypothetical protein